MSFVELVFDNVNEILEDGHVGTEDFVAITGVAMKIAQGLSLPGQEKKKIVIDVVQRIIQNSSLSNGAKLAAETFSEFALPLIIDGLKAAARGAYNLVQGKQYCCF